MLLAVLIAYRSHNHRCRDSGLVWKRCHVLPGQINQNHVAGGLPTHSTPGSSGTGCRQRGRSKGGLSLDPRARPSLVHGHSGDRSQRTWRPMALSIRSVRVMAVADAAMAAWDNGLVRGRAAQSRLHVRQGQNQNQNQHQNGEQTSRTVLSTMRPWTTMQGHIA